MLNLVLSEGFLPKLPKGLHWQMVTATSLLGVCILSCLEYSSCQAWGTKLRAWNTVRSAQAQLGLSEAEDRAQTFGDLLGLSAAFLSPVPSTTLPPSSTFAA